MSEPIKIRIAVAVDSKGRYTASGWADSEGQASDSEARNSADETYGILFEAAPDAIHFVEALIPRPEIIQPVTVQGEVKP